MNIAEKRIVKYIDDMKEEIIELLAGLVKAESPNPPGDTRRASYVLIKKFRKFGIDPDVLYVEDDKPNLIARINPGNGSQLVFNSHIDTISPGDLSRWTYDPFAAVIEGSKMYGRGVADAKASVVAMTMAAKAVKESQKKINGTMVVNLVSDEESGGFKGTKFLLDEGHLSPDFVVIGEQTNNQIAIAEKGEVWFKIKIFGRAAHASTPWHGINAIDNMVKLLATIQEKVGSKLKLMSHPLTPPPSLNIGTILGGFKINVVPDVCEVSIDRRFLPEESLFEVEKQISDIIDEFRRSDSDFKAELKILLRGSPINTSPDEKLVKVAQSVNIDLNLNGEPSGYKQASDGRFFADKKIPTIIIGPSDPKVGHTSNEYVELDDVVTTTKIYALIALRMLD